MKKLLPLLLCCAGCAHFSTTQTDTMVATNGIPETRTTTVSAFTFFTARNDLAKFKAMQSDKTQSAAVGSLGLSSTNDLSGTIQALANLVNALKTP